MDILIVNELNHRSTRYTPAQLMKDARWAVKGQGKLISYFVQIQEHAPLGARFMLVAEYRSADGQVRQANVAI